MQMVITENNNEEKKPRIIRTTKTEIDKSTINNWIFKSICHREKCSRPIS